jgi:hypothetical protein
MLERWPGLDSGEATFVGELQRFCAGEIAPKAAAVDEHASFVREQLRGLAGLGVLGANLPESCGGPGISAKALLAIVETVAGACGSTVSALTAHYLATDSILLGGTEAQRATWLPGAAAGENARDIYPATGTEITAKSWQTEAAMRMLMNNLHPDVAENPHELVVYGGIGRAARTWGDFDRIVATLKDA